MDENQIGDVSALVRYDISSEVIRRLQEQYLPLEVKGLDDKEGYTKCDEARKLVKSHRVAIEKRRKELKEDSLKYGRLVDAKARELTFPLVAIETHLQGQQDVIDKELERLEAEKKRAQVEKLNQRESALRAVGDKTPWNQIALMDDDSYIQCLADATNAWMAEKQRQKEQEEELRDARKAQAEANAKRQLAEAEAKKVREENDRLKQLELDRANAEINKAKAEIDKRNAEVLALQQKELDRERERVEEERKKSEAQKTRVEEDCADMEMFEEVKETFITIEDCWIEIVRLKTVLKRAINEPISTH